MKKISSILAVFLLTINLPAQPTIQWQKSYGGKNVDNLYSIVQTIGFAASIK